ncbi:unnamed protein product [Larinioides sclopetarius]|uniref:Uncharacterized protein n=1 Tax=Larinioides sclopetarius TaxID=280406 RepID=A0AAV1Z6D9_9ARAC
MENNFPIEYKVIVNTETFILLFIFAKRQITRFALKNRHRPHYPIGAGSSKSLCKEIERRLDVIDYIRCEPTQLSAEMKLLFQDENLVSQRIHI